MVKITQKLVQAGRRGILLTGKFCRDTKEQTRVRAEFRSRRAGPPAKGPSRKKAPGKEKTTVGGVRKSALQRAKVLSAKTEKKPKGKTTSGARRQTKTGAGDEEPPDEEGPTDGGDPPHPDEEEPPDPDEEVRPEPPVPDMPPGSENYGNFVDLRQVSPRTKYLSSIGIIRWIRGGCDNLIPGGRGLRAQPVASVERQRTGGPYERCAQFYACLNAHLGRGICVLASACPIHRKTPPAHTYASTAAPQFLYGKLDATTPATPCGIRRIGAL